jgi:hypothetical protein
VSVALLCKTSGADHFYSALATLTLAGVFLGALALQVACAVRTCRGAAPLVGPLASRTAGYMAGVFAVMLGGDAAIRLFVDPSVLPAGVAGTAMLWIEVLLPMAALAAGSGLAVVLGVEVARTRPRAR